MIQEFGTQENDDEGSLLSLDCRSPWLLSILDPISAVPAHTGFTIAVRLALQGHRTPVEISGMTVAGVRDGLFTVV